MNRWTERVLGVTALLFVVALIMGCGGIQQAAQRAKKRNELMEIGLSYHNFHDQNNKSPSGPADLQQVLLSPDAAADLNAGTLVVVWDADWDAMMKGKGLPAYVMGYESSAPANGGLVLMFDGSVNQVTAAEFNALPKAPTKAPGKKEGGRP
jgi:hypothetical protein